MKNTYHFGFLILATILFMIACTNPFNSQLEPAAKAISDGAHGGDTHFYFLPPMLPYPGRTSGQVDGPLDPEIVIEDLNDNEIVASYTRHDGIWPKRIIYHPRFKHYLAFWPTRQFDLDLTHTYRIKIYLSDTLLGYADVRFVGPFLELSEVDRDKYVPLHYGATLPIKFRIEEGWSGVYDSPYTQVPDAVPEYDQSIEGLYKGVLIGSHGSFYLWINNGTEAVYGFVIFDDSKARVYPTDWSADDPLPEEIYNFQGVFEGGEHSGLRISLNFSVGTGGVDPAVSDVHIEEHGPVQAEVFKETSEDLVKLYWGNALTDGDGYLPPGSEIAILSFIISDDQVSGRFEDISDEGGPLEGIILEFEEYALQGTCTYERDGSEIVILGNFVNEGDLIEGIWYENGNPENTGTWTGERVEWLPKEGGGAPELFLGIYIYPEDCTADVFMDGFPVAEATITVDGIQIPYDETVEEYHLDWATPPEPLQWLDVHFQFQGSEFSETVQVPPLAIILTPESASIYPPSQDIQVNWEISPYPDRVKVQVGAEFTVSEEEYHVNFTEGETSHVIPAGVIKTDIPYLYVDVNAYNHQQVPSLPGFYIHSNSDIKTASPSEVFIFTADSFSVPEATITVDGQSSDWNGIEPLILDPRDDAVASSEFGVDIRALYLARDTQYLYWRVDLWDPPLSTEVSYLLFIVEQLEQPIEYTEDVDLYIDCTGAVPAVSRWSSEGWNLIDGYDTSFVRGAVGEGKIKLSLLGSLNPKNFHTVTWDWDSGEADVTTYGRAVFE